MLLKRDNPTKTFILAFLQKTKNRIYKRRILLIFLLLIFGFGLLFFQLFFFKMNDAKFRATLLRENKLVSGLLPFYWGVRKTTDVIYLPYIFKKNSLPVYGLYIDSEEKQEMDESLPDAFGNITYSSKLWVPAKLKYNDKTYDVEVRYRGDNAVHWNAPKKSYLIKFKTDEPLNGASRLSFIIPDDRYFVVEQFNNYRADKLGLMYPASHFGNLKINGKNNGLYFIIENWSSEMLAKWGVSQESNFYGINEPIETPGINSKIKIWDNLYRWGKLIDDDHFSYNHYTELYKLIDLLNNASDKDFFSSIFNLIDKDNFYSWQIHQELINSGHQTYDNVRLYFNNELNKFYFIPWDVETDDTIAIDLYGRLAKRIFSNPLYLYEKNQKLYDYVIDDKNLKDDLAFYDKTYQEIKTALYQDRMKIYTNRWADKLIAQKRQVIVDVFNQLKDKFKGYLIFVDFGVIDNDGKDFNGQDLLAFFDINLQSYADIYLKDIKVEFSDGTTLGDYNLYYDVNFNDILDQNDQSVNDYKDIRLFTKRSYVENSPEELQLSRHRFYLVSNEKTSTDFSDSLKGVNINLENAITSEAIDSNNFEIRIINQRLFDELSKSPSLE